MISENFYPTLQQKINSTKKIVILTHYNPDGDAIGSSLALYLMLKKLNKEVQIIVPNDFPKFLKWMPNAKEIINAEHKSTIVKSAIEKAELIFCLDFNTPSRIEKLEHALIQSKAYKVLIDHHQEPEKFDLMYSDTSQPATCQMIYKTFKGLQILDKLDTEIASCIYTGIITDTGNFKYRNTTSETLNIAANLMQYNIKVDTINSNIFDNNSMGKLKLLGLVLQRVEVEPKSQASFLYITKKELLQHGFKKGDTEGFVNYGLSIENINFTVFLSEDIHKNFIKISFRSKGNIDVNHIAKTYFNGGGHINAAGGRSDDNIQNTITKIKKTLSTDTVFLNQIKE